MSYKNDAEESLDFGIESNPKPGKFYQSKIAKLIASMFISFYLTYELGRVDFIYVFSSPKSLLVASCMTLVLFTFLNLRIANPQSDKEILIFRIKQGVCFVLFMAVCIAALLKWHVSF